MLCDVPRPERGHYLDGQYHIEGPNGETADAWPAFCTAAVLLGGATPAEINSLADCSPFLQNFHCYRDIGHTTADQWKSQAEAIVAELVRWGAAEEAKFADIERN